MMITIIVLGGCIVAYFAIAFIVHSTITYWELSEPKYRKLSNSTVIQAALIWPISLLILGAAFCSVSFDYIIEYSKKLAQKRFDKKHGDRK